MFASLRSNSSRSSFDVSVRGVSTRVGTFATSIGCKRVDQILTARAMLARAAAAQPVHPNQEPSPPGAEFSVSFGGGGQAESGCRLRMNSSPLSKIRSRRNEGIGSSDSRPAIVIAAAVISSERNSSSVLSPSKDASSRASLSSSP